MEKIDTTNIKCSISFFDHITNESTRYSGFITEISYKTDGKPYKIQFEYQKNNETIKHRVIPHFYKAGYMGGKMRKLTYRVVPIDI